MSELRQDPVSGRWVVIADNRAGRPEEYRRAAFARVEISCPSCRGHEDQTPEPLMWFGPDLQAPERWEVRVVPNKYPALTRGTAWASTAADDPLFRAAPGAGRHEVVIESPDHVESFSDLTDEQAWWTFSAYRQRLRVHREDPGILVPTVFKNVGPEGGASLVHAHSQILSLPQAPEGLQREWSGARQFHRDHGRCVFCALLERESELGLRVVAQSERAIAICPYASRFAYETWILPRRHASHFEGAGDADLRDAARLLKQAIQAAENLLERPAYNYYLHTSPFDTHACDHYHWHIEFFPRVSKPAGFEWCAGWHLNTVPPERAADALRTAWRQVP